jgi:hypothetical protein
MAQTGYAQVGDLNIYCEIHGTGRPMILLHGAYMTIDGPNSRRSTSRSTARTRRSAR